MKDFKQFKLEHPLFNKAIKTKYATGSSTSESDDELENEKSRKQSKKFKRIKTLENDSTDYEIPPKQADCETNYSSDNRKIEKAALYNQCDSCSDSEEVQKRSNNRSCNRILDSDSNSGNNTDSDSNLSNSRLTSSESDTNIEELSDNEINNALLHFDDPKEGRNDSYYEEKQLTIDKIFKLIRELNSRPTDQLSEQPKGLKKPLLIHQVQGLMFMIWRENQDNPGGIVADDMGLGKTPLAIALILKQKDTICERKSLNGGTLIIVPVSIIHQWYDEFENFVEENTLKVLIHHGDKRERDAKQLAKFDVIITTYNILVKESTSKVKKILLRINWDRVILDEGHKIRNKASNLQT